MSRVGGLFKYFHLAHWVIRKVIGTSELPGKTSRCGHKCIVVLSEVPIGGFLKKYLANSVVDNKTFSTTTKLENKEHESMA